jgi:hypothetical protein
MSFRGHTAVPADKLLIYPVYGKINSSGSSYPVTNCLFYTVLQRLVMVNAKGLGVFDPARLMEEESSGRQDQVAWQ